MQLFEYMQYKYVYNEATGKRVETKKVCKTYAKDKETLKRELDYRERTKNVPGSRFATLKHGKIKKIKS